MSGFKDWLEKQCDEDSELETLIYCHDSPFDEIAEQIAEKIWYKMVDEINRVPICNCSSWCWSGQEFLVKKPINGHHPSCPQAEF